MGVLHIEKDSDPPAVEIELADPAELGYADVDERQTPEERAVLRVRWHYEDLTISGPPDLVAEHLRNVALQAGRAANDFARGYARLGVVER